MQLPGCSSHNAMRPCQRKLIPRDDVNAVKRLVNFEDRNISLFPLNVTGLFLYKFLTRTVMSSDSKRCNLNGILWGETKAYILLELFVRILKLRSRNFWLLWYFEGISSRDSWLFIHCIEEQEVRVSLKTKNFVDIFSLNSVLFRMFERRVVSTKNSSERIFKFWT